MKTIEERVQILEANFTSLQEAFLQSQSNQANTQGQIDNTSNRTDSLTPTVITKKVSIGDTEVTFNNVPNANITVFVEDEDGNYPNYTMERNSNIVTVYFEPSEYVTTVTLSIV